MDSRTVQNLLKVEGKMVTPRFWDAKIKEEKKGMPEGGTLSTFEKRKEQDGTDYAPPKEMAKVPLKLRERYSRTEWPADNHPNPLSMPDKDRNWGNQVWRRYPDGNLDVRSALQMLVEALRRYKHAPALNEVDALILSSVIPSFSFDGIPKEVVEIKAYLTPREKTHLQDMLREVVSESVIREIVDLGGA